MTDRTISRYARRLTDPLAAAAVFFALFAIYEFTLLPGLGGTEDTAKFQYIGPALGTPHDPGYPLYMIASWAASKLPIGTLAYRVNLLSAFWGAVAAAFVFLMMRRLAVPRALAATIALGLGLGRAFWEHSTYAEAYTQACAFTAAALFALLAWDDDGRDRYLFAAVAAASLAFGTHLIIVGAVPFFAWFVLTRYRWRVPARVIAVASLIVALGIAQYSYVWIRTVQKAPYLEARATSVGELMNTLRGNQFANQTFKESPLVIARSRVPAIARTVWTELGVIATAGALVGMVGLWRQRRRSAILLLGAFVGPALLLSTLGTVATHGIILPALMPLWALVGTGVAALWSVAARLAPPRARIAALAATALVTAMVPAMQARANVTDNNRRHDTFDTVYFSELFRGINGPTAFLSEDYVVGHMLQYQRYSTRASGVSVGIPRDPELVATLLSQGATVYAFSEALAELDGRISVRPVQLTDSSADARLARLPEGYIVVVAGSSPRWPRLDAIGAGDSVRGIRRGVVVALKGVGPVIVTPPDFEGAIDIKRGQPLGQTGTTAAMDVHVEVRGLTASIDVEGERVVQSTGGLAVAEMGSRLWGAYELSPGDGLRPPLDMSRRPLFQVTGVPDDACTEIGDGGWHSLSDPGSSGRLVGTIDNFRSFDAEWVVYLASEHDLRATVVSWFGANRPALDVEAFAPLREADRLRTRLAVDVLDASPELLAAPVVTRVRVKMNDDGRWASFRLGLGGRPHAGWGRAIADRASPYRGRSCALAPDLLEPDVRAQRAHLYLGPGGDWLFGPGWQSGEPTRVGFHRVMRGTESRMLVPATHRAPTTLRMSVEPIGGDASIAVSINGSAPIKGPRPATPGWNELWWRLDDVPWRAGVNDLAIEVTRPSGQAPAASEPSLRVRSIEFDWSPRAK